MDGEIQERLTDGWLAGWLGKEMNDYTDDWKVEKRKNGWLICQAFPLVYPQHVPYDRQPVHNNHGGGH